MTEEAVEYETGNYIELIEKANNLVIDSQSDYETAGEFKEELKEGLKKIEDYFEPLRKKAYDAYTEVLEKKRKACDQPQEALAIVQKHMNDYLTRINNERVAAQRKAEQEAAKAAEEERQRLLERAVKAKTEAKQEELIAKAEDVFVQPVIVQPLQMKTIKTESGVVLTGKRDIEVDVVELRKLCKAIGDGMVPLTIIEIKSQVLKTWVKSAGIRNGQVPGIVIREVVRASGR